MNPIVIVGWGFTFLAGYMAGQLNEPSDFVAVLFAYLGGLTIGTQRT